MVVDEAVEVGDEYTIVAYDTRISLTEAALDDDALKPLLTRKARALAIHKTSLTPVEVLIDHSIVPVIDNYPTTYYINVNNQRDVELTKNVEVVKDRYIDNEGSIFIKGSSFIVAKDKVDGLSNDDYAQLANASAFNDNPTSFTYKPVVIGNKLDKNETAVQYITFAVQENAAILDAPTITVEALVVDGEVDYGPEYVLVGKNFTIKGAEAHLLHNTLDDQHDSILLNGGALTSYLAGTVEEAGTPYVFAETRNNVEATTGTYEVDFGVADNSGQLTKPRLTLDVTVEMALKPDLNIVTHSQIPVNGSFDEEAQFMDAYDHSLERYVDFDEIDVDQDNIIFDTVGIYTVEYSYTDEANQTTTKTHTLAVNDGSIVEENDYFIYGENVVLNLSDIQGLSTAQLDALVSPLVHARVVDVNDGSDLDADKISITGYDLVEERIGVYPLTIVVDGVSSTKTVQLHIVNGDIDKGDKYTLVTNDTTITVNEVQTSDVDSLIINRSKAKAVSKTSHQLGVISVSHNIVATVDTYDATYSVVGVDDLFETAKVYVIDDKYIGEDQDVYIAGNPFVVGSELVDDLNADPSFADYIRYSEAHAWGENVSGPFTIMVDEDTLLKAEKGIQYVTYYVQEYPDAKYIAEVEVVEGFSFKGDDFTITGRDISISAAEAKQIIDGASDNTNIIMESSYANVKVYKNKSIDLADEAVTIDKSDVKVAAGTYDSHFALSADADTTVSTKVTVTKGLMPDFSVNEVQEVDINHPETYQEDYGMRLFDNNGAGLLDYDIVSTEAEFTDVAGKVLIDRSQLDLTKLGIYIVNYKAKDSNFNVATAKQVVVVTDGEIPEVDDYYIYAENVILDYETEVLNKSDEQIMDSIIAKYTAYAVNYKDFTYYPVTMSSLGSDFVYDRSVNTVEVHVEGDTNIKRNILVSITRGDINVGDNYKLTANDAYMTVSELKALADVQVKPFVINRAQALALPVHGSRMGTVVFDEDIEAKAQDNDVRYYVLEESTVTSDRKVYVKDKDVIEEIDEYVIMADHFPIGILDIPTTSFEDFALLADAQVIDKRDNSMTRGQLVAKPKAEVGDQPVSFVTDLKDDLQADVLARVYEGKVVSDDEYFVNARPATISVERAYEIIADLEDGDESSLRALTFTQAYTRAYEEVDSVILEENPPLEAVAGEYYVTYAVKDKQTVKVTVKITVESGELPTLTVPPYIEVKVNTAPEDFDIKQGVSAYDNNKDEAIPKDRITVSGTVDLNTVGIYPVEYSVTDANDNTVTEKSTVIVNDGSYEVIDDFVYRAKHFSIHISEVNSGSGVNPQILEKADASAYNLVKHEPVDQRDLIVVDTKGYRKELGLYKDIELGILNETIVKKVNGEVTDRNVITGDLYMISALPKVIGQIEAQALTEESIKTLMDVRISKRVDSIPEGVVKVDNFDEFSTTPDIYPMTFSVVQEADTKTTEDLRVMDRDDVFTDGKYIIAANRFYVGLDDLEAFEDEKPQRIIDLAQAYALKLDTNSESLTDVLWISGPEHVVAADQEVIFAVKELQTTKVTTYATVLKGNVFETKDYYINSQAASIPISDLADLQAGIIDIHDLMQVVVYEKGNNIPLGIQNTVTDLDTLEPKEATYDITFSFEKDGQSGTVTSPLSLRKGNPPHLEVAPVQNINLVDNDVYDKTLGLEYSDIEDDANPNAPELVVVIDGDDAVEEAITKKEVGVFTVSYTLTDSDLNTVHAYQTVIVNDGSIVIGDEYVLIANHFYINERDVVNDETHLLTHTEAIAYKIGSNNEFGTPRAKSDDYKAEEGIYDVSVWVEEEEATNRTVKANVVKDEVIKGEEYYILATKAYLGLEDAANVVDARLIHAARARAYNKRLNTEADVVVDSHDIVAVAGDFYHASFDVDLERDTSITVPVEVLPSKYVESEKEYVIAANDFYVGIDDINEGIDNDAYVALAKAYGFTRYDLVDVDVKFDESTAPTEVGDKVVSFYVEEKQDVVVNPTAHVLKGRVVQGDEYYINAQNATIHVSDADDVVKGKASLIDFAQAFAKDYFGNETDVAVLEHNVEAKEGVYSVTFYVVAEASTQVTVKITVDKGLPPELTVPVYTEIAVGEHFDDMKNVSVIDDRDGDITDKVVVDSSHVDVNVVGVYELEYTVEDSDFNVSTKKYYVVVNDGSIVITDKYILEAQSYMINVKDVIGSNEEILELSKAKAYRLSDYTMVDVAVSDPDGYTQAVNTYDIKLIVAEDPSTIKGIKAQVVYGEVVETDHYFLSAVDITIGRKDASVMSDLDIIERAQAVALHKTLSTAGTVVIEEKNLESVAGDYFAKYQVQEEIDNTLVRGIKVIDRDVVEEDNEYVIYANNFFIGDQFIKSMSKEDIVELAEAGAYAKENPKVPLTVTQVEDIIKTIGTHQVTFTIVDNTRVKAVVDKTIFKDTMYYIEADDATIKIGDLTKAITSGLLEPTVIDLTHAKGYKVNGDGSREQLPVYLTNRASLLNPRANENYKLSYSLIDPNERVANGNISETESHLIEEVKTEATLFVTADDESTPKTGLRQLNSLMYVFIVLLGIALIITELKKYRAQKLSE